MVSIAVTGAAGAVGQRTVRQLAADPSVGRLVALDRASMPVVPAKVEDHRLDLLVDDLRPWLDGCSVVVHLAEDGGRRDDASTALAILDRVLDHGADVGCDHVVLLSSATVYGAHADNPVPMTEAQPIDPNEELAFAVAKQKLEAVGGDWARTAGRELCVLRPTTTLSERGASWVATAMRTAAAMRPEQIDPPVQFLHHDDLASALSFVTRRRLTGVFNVAPDGWIGSEVFRDLAGGPPVRLPSNVTDRISRAGRRYGLGTSPPGIEAYVQYPWVVANDRIRTAGWVPAFSNEEAFVLGTPAPWWSLSAQRRQEVALGAAGLGIAGATAAAAALARRVLR